MKRSPCTPVLILAAVVVGVAAAPMEPDNEVAQEIGKLRIITITQEKIEGEYYSPVGGIHFQSEVKGEYHFLSITTADGQPLMVAKQFHESASLMRITETDFLVMNS